MFDALTTENFTIAGFAFDLWRNCVFPIAKRRKSPAKADGGHQKPVLPLKQYAKGG
jgi:hypothetical protein